jgi:CheY-like chemotaxis protein
MKSNPQFRRIPVVALTTSMSEDDVAFSYDMGVNSYITKPVTFRALVDIMSVLSKYWFEVVELPPRELRWKINE